MMMVPASSTVSLISLCGRTIVPFRNTSSCTAKPRRVRSANVQQPSAFGACPAYPGCVICNLYILEVPSCSRADREWRVLASCTTLRTSLGLLHR